MVLHILEQESSLVSVILPPVPRGCLPCTLFLKRPLFLEEAWNFHPAKFQNKWCSSLEVAVSKVGSHWILCELEVYVVPIPCCRNLSSSRLQSHRRWPPRLFQLLDVSDSLQVWLRQNRLPEAGWHLRLLAHLVLAWKGFYRGQCKSVNDRVIRY